MEDAPQNPRLARVARRRDRALRHFNGRSDLRWRISALASGETLEVPVEEARWEALNSARKRASADTGLKYRARQNGDKWFVLAYDPNLEKPSLAAMATAGKAPASSTDADQLREVIREELESFRKTLLAEISLLL